MDIKRIAVLGSTGSIGKNALEVISCYPEKFRVSALSAHSNVELLLDQARLFNPDYVAITGDASMHREALSGIRTGHGEDAIYEACLNADIVLIAIMGMAGLPAFEFCLKNRIPVALATKEAMVCGGKIARKLMDDTGTPVLPVDSELSAIWQCLEGNRKAEIKTIYLTASGGPFRTWPAEKIAKATLNDALNHPTWEMGKKITVDCATMVNKGLEIMETRWLFDVAAEKIKVLVHPESVVHSMVEFSDNCILAQLGERDMKLPIIHALSYPDRLVSKADPLDLLSVGMLHFEAPCTEKFPCLELAYEAVKNDGALQLVFNSANETAVSKFLNGDIAFVDIYNIIKKSMKEFSAAETATFADIYELDKEVKRFADSCK